MSLNNAKRAYQRVWHGGELETICYVYLLSASGLMWRKEVAQAFLGS